jgi:regulator of sigma E protease
MISIIISVAAFLFAIVLLVVFHEFGHCWVAQKLGVKVLRFSVGFGKPLWRHQAKNGVEYRVCAIPLGGYVKMLDERDGDVPEDQKSFAFNRQSLWRRFLIVLAGPLFNFLFAILAYGLMFTIGATTMVARIGEITPDSIAYRAGLHEGEDIIQIDDASTVSWQSVYRALLLRLGDHDRLKVVVKAPDGSIDTRWMELDQWQLKGNKPNLLHALGISPYLPQIPPIVQHVISDSAATQAGFLVGDQIIAVDGKPIKDWMSFSHFVAHRANESFSVTVIRDGAQHILTVTPRLKESDTGELVGFVGLEVKVPPFPKELLVKERMSPGSALWEGVKKTQENAVMTCHLLGRMLVGKIGVQHFLLPKAPGQPSC